MIKSMTGFGRGEYVSDAYKITVEMKAVNHRYCDISLKLPRKFSGLENTVRSFLKKEIHRGKVDVYLSYEELSEASAQLSLNRTLGRAYYEAAQTLAADLGVSGEISAAALLRFPEVVKLSEPETPEESVEAPVMEAVKIAAAQFAQSREKEGENLSGDIAAKLDGMEAHIAAIEARYPEMVRDYRSRLTEKVRELLADVSVDESRIATEVVIYADKISVDEETVRLRSHIAGMRDEMKKGGNIGRKLDFIAQEMNREANTILSKANDLTVSGHAIDLKTDIEKIREQVQNIE